MNNAQAGTGLGHSTLWNNWCSSWFLKVSPTRLGGSLAAEGCRFKSRSDHWGASTLLRRNMKTEISLRKCIKCFPFTKCSQGIWKRSNQRLFWIHGWGKLEQGNHNIIATPLLSKSSFSKMLSVHFKRQRRHFQIPAVWRGDGHACKELMGLHRPASRWLGFLSLFF